MVNMMSEDTKSLEFKGCMTQIDMAASVFGILYALNQIPVDRMGERLELCHYAEDKIIKLIIKASIKDNNEDKRAQNSG